MSLPRDQHEMLQAYDRDGAQGADAPAENHPATIEERAAEDEKRRECIEDIVDGWDPVAQQNQIIERNTYPD